VKRIGKTMTMVKVAILLLAASLAWAQDDTVPITLGWAPSPTHDDEGRPCALAVRYDVYLQRDGAAEQYLATVVDDTVYVLAAERGVVQRIRVYGYDSDGVESPPSEWSDPIYFEPERTHQGPDRQAPSLPVLDQNYPNPFNPETRLVYGVPEDTPAGAAVALEIYDVRGKRVRSFPVETSAGWHEQVWDGRDDRGQVQATGTYVLRYVCDGQVAVGKLTMVK
jgi:hypothetical protein